VRAAVESALVDAEVIRQNMLADFIASMLKIAPQLARAAALMEQGEKEAFYAQSVAALAADVLSDYAGELEGNAEATVESFARAVLGK